MHLQELSEQFTVPLLLLTIPSAHSLPGLPYTSLIPTRVL